MKKIAIFAPSPISGSGGVGRIYNFAQALGRNGYECHVFVFDSGCNSASVLSSNANKFYNTVGFICHTENEVLDCVFDLVIATRWDTVKLANQVQSKAKAYLIQDFESYFNAVGDSSISGENSYLSGFKPLTYGRWLARKLQVEFGNTPIYFDFASDLKSFRCTTNMQKRLNSQPKIAFIYQNDKQRRCPILGIEALGIVKHVRPDVKLYFVGTEEAPQLWYDVSNTGNLSLKQLNDLYNKCQVGLSLSSTNPSCNAFDMMASGLPSVDLYRENNIFDIPSEGVLLAHQTAESIAEAVLHLINNPVELITRSKSGIKFMQDRSQDKEVKTFLAAVDTLLFQTVNQLDLSVLGYPLYTQPPVVAKFLRNDFTKAHCHHQRSFSTFSGKHDHNADNIYYSTNELEFEPILVEMKLATKSALKTAASKVKVNLKRQKVLKFLVKKLGLDSRLDASLFDEYYYLEKNPDVAASKMNPFKHFIRYGAAEGRSPSPYFETDWYLSTNADVGKSGMSAIVHYLFHGSKQNRSPNSELDSVGYLSQYPDVRAANLHPLLHYVIAGESEGREPGESFSPTWYKDNNLDVVKAGVPLLLHYLSYGRSEGRLAIAPSYEIGKTETQNTLPLIDGKSVSVFEWQAKDSDLEPQFERDKKQILSGSQLDLQVSFDIWSTVIHRRCHPDEVKLRSARLVLLNAWNNILPGMRTSVILMTARMRAENASAPNRDYEYCFDDAVDLWLKNILVSSVDQETLLNLKRQILEHELAAEIESIELDTNSHNALKELRRAPIFISDFYMAPPFIENLLRSVGVLEYFARGYVSCDGFENKRSGKLFHKVLKDFKLVPSQLLHVGDNPLADMERPISLGINVEPYVSKKDEARNAWYTEAFNALRQGDNSIHERRILALIEECSRQIPLCFSDQDKRLYEVGCKVGLLAFGYCLNLMQDGIINNNKEIIFFAREGILLKSIYDLISNNRPFTREAPLSKLLFVSRRATFAASLKSLENKDLMRMWTMYSHQSPYAFAKSLNLDTNYAIEAAELVGIDAHKVISAPWQDKNFQAFMNEPSFKQYALLDIARQRALLKNYIAQELAPDQKKILISDIGWRGTIQDNVSHLLKIPTRGHYFALFKYLNEQPENSSKVGWLSDVNCGGKYELPDSPSPLEMIFNGAGGSTIGYKVNEAGVIEPVLDTYPGEEAVINTLKACRIGMEAIVPILVNYVKLHGLMASDFLNLNRKIANDIIMCPPAVIADLYGQLEHNETFGVGAVVATQDASFSDAVNVPAGAALHSSFNEWLGKQWTQGMSRQSAVQKWWLTATIKQRSSAPLSVTKVFAPNILKSVGSTLAVYAPQPINSSGGYKTIINTVRGLVEMGLKAEIFLEYQSSDTSILEEYLGNVPATIHTSWSSHKNATVALATIAHSAKYVNSKVTANCLGYLVQDDEALFQPIGDSYVDAENSYALGLNHFTIGNWLTHMINNKYLSPAYPAGFGVDTEIYKLVGHIKREKTICALYQPEKLRRGSKLVLEALSLVKKRYPDVNILFYGSNEDPQVNFDFVNLGLMTDLSQINMLYNRCIAGVCLSLSNPSRIPFEMSASGCTPVDVYRYNNLMDYNSDMGILAFQSAESIAEALLKLLLQSELTKNHAENLAVRVTCKTLEWERDTMAANILNVLEGKKCVNWETKLLYDREPIVSLNDDNFAVQEFCKQQLRLAMTKPIYT